MISFHLSILWRKVEAPKALSTYNKLLDLEFDGIEHLVGYICKKLKTVE